MENMIKRIIDMDQKAREITESAQKEKLESEKEIAEKAKQLRADYLERARRRIQVNDETERALAEEEWRKRQAVYAAQRQRLEDTYAAKADEWADTIVRRVLEG